MMQNDFQLKESLQQAAMYLQQGDRGTAKRMYYQALTHAPSRVAIRETLRSAMQSEQQPDLSRFGDEFESCVQEAAMAVVSSAVNGWLYSMVIDRAFLDGAFEPPTRKVTHTTAVCETPLGDRQADAILRDLLAIPDIQQRWRAVRELVTANERSVLEDSFAGVAEEELTSQFVAGQHAEGLNVVIIGGGCVGLAMANALKWSFREKIDVLVIENRVQAPHRKPPYKRQWLTHIPNALLEGVYDPIVCQLLAEFGRPRYIGATLAVLETLLLVSNKKLGVRFLFAADYDLSFIDGSRTHIVFDATGGRFEPPSQGWSEGTLAKGESTIRIQLPSIPEFGKGHRAHGITNTFHVQSAIVDVKKNGRRYSPAIHGVPVRSAMFKLTNIPIELYEPLLAFTRERNPDSLLYIWPGNLKPEINEALALINLDMAGLRYLERAVPAVSKLDGCLKQGLLETDALDERIRDLFRLLQASPNHLEQIRIEPPFLFAPYVLWMTGKLDRLWGRPVVPIGDAMMNGNPKSGNGLGTHLKMVRQFHDMALLLFGEH